MKKVDTSAPEKGAELKKEFQDKANSYFEKNKECEALHVTDDGQMFTNKYFARQHADTLDIKEVIKFKNPFSKGAKVEEDNTELDSEDEATEDLGTGENTGEK